MSVYYFGLWGAIQPANVRKSTNLFLDKHLVEHFGDHIIVHVVDPQSLRGVLKSPRYRVRKYPTSIVDEQELIVDWNRIALDRAIEIRSAEKQRD